MTRQVRADFIGQSRFHLALNVRDLDASLSFYQTVFAMEPTKIKADYAKFEVPDPSVNFTLNVKDAGSGPDRLSHMGIQLSSSDALATLKAKIEDAGLLEYEEKQTDCCYARQDKFWLRDPDGNMLEFFVVFEDVEATPLTTSACCGA